MKKIQLIAAVAGLIVVTMQSCSKEKEGCVDSLACNFDSEAEADDGSCTYALTWYQDLDGDGLGNPHSTTTDCTQPAGYVDNSGDGADIVVSATQRAVVTYVGATWCPPCGAYGDPTKKYMESTHGSNVVILNVQSGDAISSSSEFGPKFGGVFNTFVSNNGIPHAFYSAANYSMTHRGFYTSASSNNSAADNDINSIKASTLEVGVAASATISGNTVTVKTLSKFYTAAGQHYIGVYLLEDGVMATQKSSIAPDAITDHNNVVRTAAYTGNTLGIESMGTSFTLNQQVAGSYTIPVSTGWNKSKLQVAVVVWKSNIADGISNAIIVNVN